MILTSDGMCNVSPIAVGGKKSRRFKSASAACCGLSNAGNGRRPLTLMMMKMPRTITFCSAHSTVAPEGVARRNHHTRRLHLYCSSVSDENALLNCYYFGYSTSVIFRVGDFCVLRFYLCILSIRLLPQRVQHALAYPGSSVLHNNFHLLYSLLALHTQTREQNIF